MPTSRSRRRLERESDGTLSEADTGATVHLEELAEGLRIGSRFRVSARGTGVDCTVQVFADALGVALSGDGPRGYVLGPVPGALDLPWGVR
ncbi:hypothetical protein DFR70_102925 [Nocardia tenerifensis]|uniref:Uncharacterized protein n=1 Tax=Nocardia tenerifensis TaxID=228006 RepID=A0A318KLC2_9NOCA|nr:hypothetical protein [Nocardia tenerifensis]PXX69237.1 hypothetical protein DFR70_102925 [Nocardia tenerifensis]